jgi:hypothetical protein
MKYRVFATVLFASFFFAGGAYAQSTYYLPHVANGNFGTGSEKTTFVLFNNSNTHATATLNLTADNGGPLPVTIAGYGTNSTFSIDLPAGASQMLQTDGQGDAVQGAATVTSGSSIGVSAIFSVYDSQGNYVAETGVGNADLQTNFVIPVDTTGFFNTGLALYNPSSSPVAPVMALYNTAGQQVGVPVTLPLGGHEHVARFIAGLGQLFPSITSFQGTLVVRNAVPIAAMVLRQYSHPPTLSFTSLPVVPDSSTKTTLDLAQVADGGGLQTSFLIFNISSTPANVTLTLTKNDGSPLIVTIPGRGPNSSFIFTNVAPGASLFLQTDGTPASFTAGAATITSNVPVGAAAIFTVLNAGVFQTETGVGDSPVLTSFTLPVDITGNFNTGVAFFNPSSSTTAKLTFHLLDANGAQVGAESQRDLLAKNHLAIFVNELFPGTSNFRGTLAVTSTIGVAALTLRMNSSPLSYTTLPVVSGIASSTGPAPSAALLSKTETGIAATSNVIKNEDLPSGFKLTGTISGPGQGTAVVASAGQSNIFAGSVNQQTGKYLVVLPSGTYNLTVSFVPTGVPSGQGLSVTSSVTGSVQVSGDTVFDITLPSIALFNVSGNVNGLGNLSSASGMRAVLTSNDSSIQADFGLVSGTYQGVLPAATYTAGLTASITFPPSLFQSQSLGIFNLGVAAVSGNTVIPAFTVPATAKLSGMIHGAASPAVGLSISATGPSSSITSNSTADMLTAKYQMILPKNTNYTVNVSMLLTSGADFLGTITFPFPGLSLNLLGDTFAYDFTVPTLPVRVTISGLVTDSQGHPVSGVAVSATSQSITGAPSLRFSNFGQTDASGNYSLSVLSGTNYQLVFIPPPPQ